MRFGLLPFLLLVAGVSSAQENPRQPGQGRARSLPATPTAPAPAPSADFTELATSVTRHSMELPSGKLSYTATAGQIPLRNDQNEVECRMFYAAYTKDDADDRSRPVTFAFNGGPGSATMWLHMGTLGPRRAPFNDDGSIPKAPFEAVDNHETWLDFTDVVCVDAPATGYSRLTKSEYGPKYFGITQDIAAFTEFVRGWLKQHHRYRSPIFIAGESYGGIRGSGLSASLFRAGIMVSGFVSISGTNSYLTLDGMRGNDATYVGFFPSLAACAWYHHKLGNRYASVDQVVTAAQKWVDAEYASVLQRGDSLSDAEKDRVAQKMSEFLGVNPRWIRGLNLRVSEGLFMRELLRDDSLTIGRYDGRLTGKEETRVGDRGSGDPSDEAVSAVVTMTINDYLDRELGIKTDLKYLNSGSVRPWQNPEGSYGETASDLRRVLVRNPHFRVLYCCGYYDLACPLNATVFSLNHMGLDKDARSRVSFATYPAGHMMYIEKGSRKKLHDDVAKFVSDALAR